jgi:ADP-ribosyl-[dinitrogen reductase] hydrolase
MFSQFTKPATGAIPRTTLQDRYRASLVGCLAGDAAGAPYETWRRPEIEADIVARNGLHMFSYHCPFTRARARKDAGMSIKRIRMFPGGRPTDDTEQAAVLAESIVRLGRIDPSDIWTGVRATIIDKKSMLWMGLSLGAGRQTRRMITPETYEEGQAISTELDVPTNGSLMRAQPLALYFGLQCSVNYDEVRDACISTHRHPVAVDATYAYTVIHQQLLAGKSLTSAVASAFLVVHEEAVRNILRVYTEDPGDPFVEPGSGAALVSLHVALWAMHTNITFKDVIQAAVCVGGDTDTYAAIAGGLAGAVYGMQGIPQEWLDVMLGTTILTDLADGLYEISQK